MIPEVAILDVIPDKTAEFEVGFQKGTGHHIFCERLVGASFTTCLKVPNLFILLVRWQHMEDHIIGFRESNAYLEWKKLLHHFYSPFPVVEHYTIKYEK